MFMETETNKKSVDPKYKKRSKVIIIISLLVLLWCVKDLFEVVVTPDEMNGFRTAKDMAIKALQKHIPKEPIWEGDGYADGSMVYDTWRCPECDTPYEEDEEYHYCPICGQQILWRVEDND